VLLSAMSRWALVHMDSWQWLRSLCMQCGLMGCHAALSHHLQVQLSETNDDADANVQIDGLNGMAERRQREAQRLQKQVRGILARPAAGASLPQLAAQASLAATLEQQNEALAAENEALRHQVHASKQTEVSGGQHDDEHPLDDVSRLELLAATAAIKVLTRCRMPAAACYGLPCHVAGGFVTSANHVAPWASKSTTRLYSQAEKDALARELHEKELRALELEASLPMQDAELQHTFDKPGAEDPLLAQD
jgi:hypothetical protein